MIADTEFSDIGKNKSNPSTVWRWARWLLVYPLVGLAGCHMLLTGSPIPLWYTERLDHPVVVKEVTDTSLVLADGRSVPLPFIKRLPKNDPVFLKALKHGVEVKQDGEVIGILKVGRMCANGDPFVWVGRRINLSDLAGFMDPDGIDDSIVLPEEIKSLKENESRSLDRHGVPYMVLHKTHRLRQIYEAAKSRVEQEPNLIRSFSREQIDQ
jgi:hypothetical protein